MTAPDTGRPVPVLYQGIMFTTVGDGPAPEVTVTQANGTAIAVAAAGPNGAVALEPVPESDLSVEVAYGGSPQTGGPLRVQVGGWAGRVDWAYGGLVSGWAVNRRAPGHDQVVVAFDETGVWARAVARADAGGRFSMILPAEATRPGRPVALRLGIAGSDYLLDGGLLQFGGGAALADHARATLLARAAMPLSVRIKISCPNLKEAPMWGDYHFANSLSAAFERIGYVAGVDTMDSWYSRAAAEDVVLSIRGRHRVDIDRSKINIMWLISHPDRIPEQEFADYDHIAVASDIYAEELKARGLPSVSVLHQATDATLFHADLEVARKPAALFVGNSRREYRTMVKWCVQKDIPLELFGGGWDGVLPEGMVAGTSVSNAELPDYYAGHLMLLNDHWDSMRENGFLSNRLFDGSAVGTPILTDPVEGLADVFGDAISVAGDIETFSDILHDCLDDPAPYLARAARAREIVLGAHTFDHRARQLSELIDRAAARKRRL
jgi:hypothetical protein